jgi:Tfp pilus assembly protein PilV
MSRKTKNKKISQKKYPAFSFIEVMMAIFVIAIGILGTFTPLEKAIIQSHESRNQIAASLLAQEGIELIRNLRDNSALQGNKAFEKFPNNDNTGCTVDVDSDLDCSATDYKINESASGFLAHNAGTATRWSRSMDIEYSPIGENKDGANSAKISVKVWWGSNNEPGICTSVNHCVEAVGELSKWLE